MPTKRGKQVPMKTAGKAQGRNQRATIPAGRRMQDIKHSPEVTHLANREYVTDWGAGTTFALSPYTVQPRNTGLFPRLSAIAARYEKYQFKKLWFHYRTSAVTTDTGSAFMYFDPDCYDTAASSKLILLNHRNSARNKLYEDFVLKVDPKDLGPVRFCRSIAASTGDQNLYDAGLLRLGAISSAQKVVGELEVEYEIDLISPNIDPEDLVTPVYDYYDEDANVAANDNLSNVFYPTDLEDSSTYLVPVPVTTGGGGTSALAVKGLTEFIVEIFLTGTGITTPPTLVSNAPTGEKKTISNGGEVYTTAKLWQKWNCFFNNPANVQSLLTFTGLVASTLTACKIWIYPTYQATAPPTLSYRHLSRLQSFRDLSKSLSKEISAAAVEPAALVAKSHGGTCVMLPDLSSPKVPVPAPSPPRFQVVCFRCKCPDLPCNCEFPDHVVLDNEKQKLVCSYNKK